MYSPSVNDIGSVASATIWSCSAESLERSGTFLRRDVRPALEAATAVETRLRKGMRLSL